MKGCRAPAAATHNRIVVAATVPAHPPMPSRLHACSAHSPDSDDMLSFISSYLTTHPRSMTSSQPAALASGGTSRSSGSGAIELRTDARLWEVQWPELTILRLLGRGSFGAVYLAEWNRTRVAVKVLISKGERLWNTRRIRAKRLRLNSRSGHIAA